MGGRGEWINLSYVLTQRKLRFHITSIRVGNSCMYTRTANTSSIWCDSIAGIAVVNFSSYKDQFCNLFGNTFLHHFQVYPGGCEENISSQSQQRQTSLWNPIFLAHSERFPTFIFLLWHKLSVCQPFQPEIVKLTSNQWIPDHVYVVCIRDMKFSCLEGDMGY